MWLTELEGIDLRLAGDEREQVGVGKHLLRGGEGRALLKARSFRNSQIGDLH